MQRLSGMDASFLYTETPTGHMHVTGVIVADATTMAGGYDFERIKDLIRARLHVMPMFRRRIAEVPFSVDHPVWIEDPGFDLDHHVHRVQLRPPGGQAELAELVGDLASRPLDRSRPLWEMWVAEGAEDGTVSLITKMHHASIDGVTGADLMSQLFDLSPDAPDPEPPEEEWVPDEVPNDTKLFTDSIVSRVSDPLQPVRALTRTVNSLASVARTALGSDDGGPSAALPFTAPRTMFTGSLTPNRSVAFGQADLEDFKVVKTAYDCKVNDVVLATCSVALRAYLQENDDLPDGPLVVMCPVSVHGDGAEGTNQVSSMAVHLPVQLEDPVDQLELIREDTKAAKEMQNALGADMLRDITQFAPPMVFNQAMQLYTRSGLANVHRPVQNGVISNVPGPPIPLYVAGAEVKAVYPFGPLIEGAGLNITVISNRGNMDFGIIACPELAPDIHRVANAWEAAVRALRKRADAAG